MRKSVLFAGLATIVAISFSSCSKSEVDTPDVPETLTHTVTIKAGAPQTRTEIVEGTSSASFKWSSDDAERFKIFENSTAGTDITLNTNDNYVTATLGATFTTTTAEEYVYTANMARSRTDGGNPKISTTQSPTATSFDPSADILVAKTQSFPSAQSSLSMQFYRPVAINKMTLKGITAGTTVSSVEISGNKNIAGYYNLSDDTWNANNSNPIKVTVNQTATEGKIIVYFVTLPVEDVVLTLKVTTSDATYTKTFSKPISFKEGQVTVFGVSGMSSSPTATFEYNSSTWLTEQGITLPSSGNDTNLSGSQTVGEVSLSSTSGSTPTRIHNTDGEYDLRVYKNGGSIALSSTSDYVIESIKFDGTTSGMSSNVGTFNSSSKTWTGLGQSITFIASDTWKIKTISVGYRKLVSDDKFFVISPYSSNVEYTATSAEFIISANNVSDLNASSDSDGFTSASISGNKLTVNFEANTDNTARDIVVTVNSENANMSQIITITQAGAPASTAISSIVNGGTYSITGKVAGLSTRGFILADNTGAIYVYTNSDVTQTYTIGQTVSVSGTVTAYNKGLQFPQTSSITPGTSGEFTYPSPVEYTADEILTYLDNSNNRLATYVIVNGILEKSGNYYNIKVGSTTANATLVYAPTSYTQDYSGGESVTVKGYAVNITSSKCGIIVTEISTNTTPVLLFEDITDVAAGGVSEAKITGTATNVTGWTPTVSYTGCVSSASINESCTEITYSVRANTEATEKTGTIVVTLSKSGETDVVSTVNVSQKANVLSYSWDLTTNSYSSSGEGSVTWTSDKANMVLTKGSSSTNANNYLGGGSNTHTRFYKSQVLTITPETNVNISSVVITVPGSSYLAGFTGGTWSNATCSASGTTLNITPIDGSNALSCTISAATRVTKVEFIYSTE